MTATALEQLIRLNNLENLEKQLLSVPEAEWAGLLPTALGILKVSQLPGSLLTILAFGNWEHVARLPTDQFWLTEVNSPMVRVLDARRPTWMDKWVVKLLETGHWPWEVVRAMVRKGICRKPDCAEYTIWMTIGIHWKAIRIGLQKDPDLLDDEIWRIFTVDPGTRTMMHAADDPSDRRSWMYALLELSKTGKLDRERLLTASITALRHHVNASNIGWLCRFHEALEPSLDERVKRQSEYLSLLDRQAAAAGFALDALKVIAAEGQLDIAAFVSAVEPVFAIAQKAQPIQALAIMKLAAKHAPAQAMRLAEAAGIALSHGKPDVRNAAIKLVEHLNQVAGAPAQPSQLNLALREAREAQQAEATPAPTPRHESVDLAPLVEQARALPARWRKLAGVDSCLASIEANGMLEPVAFEAMAVPRLDPAARIQPIESLDELIDQLLAAVERLDDADQFERLLDGLSRLGATRPLDFAARTAPLLKRTDKYALQFDVMGAHPRNAITALVLGWLRDQAWQPRVDEQERCYDRAIWTFICARVAALSRRIVCRVAGPLLAAPTHRAGWLCPLEFVRRLLAWQEAAIASGRPFELSADGRGLDRHDFIQAMLRLAPDRREEAAKQAARVQGMIGHLARHALGAGPVPRADDALLTAANSARIPSADSRQTTRFDWKLCGPTSDRRHPHLAFSMDPPRAPRRPADDLPTALQQRLPEFFMGSGGRFEIQALAAVWPANLDAAFAWGAGELLGRLDMPASTLEPLSCHLEPLFDPDTPFGDMARLAVALATLSRDPGASGMAVDALIALIDDGRCVGEEIGRTYAKMMPVKGLVQLNRMAKAWQVVAVQSALHRHVAIRAMTAILAELRPPAPNDLHHLLSPLRDWQTAADEGLADAARPILESVNGSGKTASLATALLKRSGNAGPGGRAEVNAAALRGRIARARRWMGNT